MPVKKPAIKKPAVKKEKKEEPIKKPVIKEEVKKPVKSGLTFIYQIGRRKSAIARVKFYLNPVRNVISNGVKGEGKIEVNRKDFKLYFPYIEYQDIILAPLKLMGEDKGHNIRAIVKGGGTRAQAEAIRLGIARALVKLNPDYRKSLRGVGYLTRDSRMKERKKPGLKRARRAPQWSKR